LLDGRATWSLAAQQPHHEKALNPQTWVQSYSDVLRHHNVSFDDVARAL
jgi:hypothetical protein